VTWAGAKSAGLSLREQAENGPSLKATTSAKVKPTCRQNDLQECLHP
jgi:hypothetical protein